MTDKEVGELWARIHEARWAGRLWPRKEIRELIAKLVEERAARSHDYGIKLACEDFGIDPEEFEKGKGNDPVGQTMNDHS
jgi:hypothetical protein